MLEGTSVETEVFELFEEYEKRESIESKIAKDADNLDVDFELKEQAAKGSQLENKWQDNRAFVAKERLFTASARAMFDQLLTADPP